jgi:hypothetical protein
VAQDVKRLVRVLATGPAHMPDDLDCAVHASDLPARQERDLEWEVRLLEPYDAPGRVDGGRAASQRAGGVCRKAGAPCSLRRRLRVGRCAPGI